MDGLPAISVEAALGAMELCNPAQPFDGRCSPGLVLGNEGLRVGLDLALDACPGVAARGVRTTILPKDAFDIVPSP